MIRLQGEGIYLAAMEREHVRAMWIDSEYDFANPAEPLHLGQPTDNADEWFDEMRKEQGKKHIELGVFLNDGTIIGDISLHDIDWKNGSCSIGLGVFKLCHRGKGFGKQAVRLMIEYGFTHLSLERISADTLDINPGAQKSLAGCGFQLEGRERKAVRFGRERRDRLRYAILAEDFFRS